MNAQTFIKAVEALGFHVEHTGGGCTTYVRYFKVATPDEERVGGEGDDEHVISITQDGSADIKDEYMESVGIDIGAFRGEGDAYYDPECEVFYKSHNNCGDALNCVLDYIRYVENYRHYLCTVPASGHFFIRGYKNLSDDFWSVDVSNPALSGSDIIELTKYWVQEGIDLQTGQHETLELEVAQGNRQPYTYYKDGGRDCDHHKVIGDVTITIDRVA